METMKEKAINAISELPDTATIDDMMYRLYVIDKVKKGQEAIKKGDSIPANHLMEEIDTW
ncbi:MAG: hypothetical protein GY940_36955 [bacterium]|nr:hypothetical protein [bacterium]